MFLLKLRYLTLTESIRYCWEKALFEPLGSITFQFALGSFKTSAPKTTYCFF